MIADARIYDSERLARYYARNRPPIHEAICARLLAALPTGSPIRTALDVGCGAGASTAVLVPRATSVIGIDPYGAMLRQARRRVPTACFVQASAACLPVAAASIDLVTAAGSLNYTDDGFVVECSLSADDYVEYLMGETNVEAAVSAGMNEQDARDVCRGMFEPLFAGGARRIGFDCVLVVAAKRVDRPSSIMT